MREEVVLPPSSSGLQPDEKIALPLKGAKPKPFKRSGILLLSATVIAVIGWLAHQSHADEKKSNDNDSYALHRISPISKALPANEMPEQKIDEHQAFQQKMVEAKARDFIERLQVSQNIRVEGYTENTYSTPRVNNEERPSSSSLLRADTPATDNPNTAFLLRASNSKAGRELATTLGPLSLVVGQGKFIFGTLEVAIHSDLPGQVRAIVAQDVYGEQGTRILIPKGSRLIGEYRSGLSNNQSRLFTIWTRLIEPNGIDIALGSEGTDYLGRAGLTGQVDYHFFDRFGGALLVSIVGAGAANVGVDPSVDQNNSVAFYRESVAQAMGEQAKNLLNQNMNIPATIHIPQGEKVMVFVNRDLDFSQVYR